MPALRVVLDTNVFVLGLAYPGSIPGKIVSAWRQGGLSVVLSRYILGELTGVLPRLNHRLNWSEADFADMIDILAISADLVEGDGVEIEELRDKNDMPVLGSLIAASADYLITGDGDLLALAGRYPIISPADFWAKHGG